jgi:hypothetical protein
MLHKRTPTKDHQFVTAYWSPSGRCRDTCQQLIKWTNGHEYSCQVHAIDATVNYATCNYLRFVITPLQTHSSLKLFLLTPLSQVQTNCFKIQLIFSTVVSCISFIFQLQFFFTKPK